MVPEVSGNFPYAYSSPQLPGYAAASTDDHKVLVDAADTTPGFLGSKLVAGDGISLVLNHPDANEQIIIAASAAGPASYAQELFGYTLTESESAITRTGVPGTDASGTRAFAMVVQQDFTCNFLNVSIRNVGGSFMRLGIYDANGNLLQKTARFSPVSNSLMKIPLLTPVALSGEVLYYLGYWTDDTTGNLQFVVLTGRSTSSRSPLMQLCDPNEMPNNIGTGFALTGLRPWLAMSAS